MCFISAIKYTKETEIENLLQHRTLTPSTSIVNVRQEKLSPRKKNYCKTHQKSVPLPSCGKYVQSRKSDPKLDIRIGKSQSDQIYNRPKCRVHPDRSDRSLMLGAGAEAFGSMILFLE